MKAVNFIRLTIPTDISYLPVVQLSVKEAARMHGLNEDELSDVELAVEEAVVNVIKHAFEPEEHNTFDIVCEHIPMGVEITIKEKGIPFDPDVLPQYSPGQDVEGMPSMGLGVLLMKKSMDKVLFRNLGREGIEVHMIKYASAKNVKEILSDTETAVQDQAARLPQVIAGQIDYTVRRMEPREAIEVSRCAYKSHGYTFFDEHIYCPDQIIALNRSGQMISAVAVTKENSFMGHGAIIYPAAGARIAETTFFFVNPEYRSQGCMGRIFEFLFATEKSTPLEGLYGYSVTNHLFTQKTSSKYGYADCGIELATSPSSWVFKGIDGDHSQRVSVVVCFKYLREAEHLLLYPPAHHRDMVEKLYRGLGASHDFAAPSDSDGPASEERSVIDTLVNGPEGNAELYVTRYGRDTVREIKHTVRDLCIKQISSINLYLNMEDPLTYHLTARFEEMGFFFSGILPKTIVGDALILQYLNNVEVDYSKLMLNSSTAKEILSYVRKCDPNLAL